MELDLAESVSVLLKAYNVSKLPDPDILSGVH